MTPRTKRIQAPISSRFWIRWRRSPAISTWTFRLKSRARHPRVPNLVWTNCLLSRAKRKWPLKSWIRSTTWRASTRTCPWPFPSANPSSQRVLPRRRPSCSSTSTISWRIFSHAKVNLRRNHKFWSAFSRPIQIICSLDLGLLRIFSIMTRGVRWRNTCGSKQTWTVGSRRTWAKTSKTSRSKRRRTNCSVSRSRWSCLCKSSCRPRGTPKALYLTSLGLQGATWMRPWVSAQTWNSSQGNLCSAWSNSIRERYSS